jgi:methionine-rich copper-binding protein CopC
VTTPGTYVVTYHVVARDGHPTSGHYNFVLRGAGAK